MKNKGEIILPDCSSDDGLAKKSGDFFMRKTAEIRYVMDTDISSTSEAIVMDADVMFQAQPQKRESSTQDETRDIVMKRYCWNIINGSWVESTFHGFKKVNDSP